MAKVFISYAKEDYESAKRLFDTLRSAGHDPWLDKECLLPGQRWENAIREAVCQSNYFVALLSPHSIEKRGYVQKEIRLGLSVLEEVPDSQIFLIPARLAECQPSHQGLCELQWLDLFPNWDDGVNKLRRVLEFAPVEAFTLDLAGTTWIGRKTIRDRWSFTLRDDHVVEYDQSGIKYSNGTWRQVGKTLFMEFNREYSQYRGDIYGNEITGTAQNVAGMTWGWHVKRVQEKDQEA